MGAAVELHALRGQGSEFIGILLAYLLESRLIIRILLQKFLEPLADPLLIPVDLFNRPSMMWATGRCGRAGTVKFALIGLAAFAAIDLAQRIYNGLAGPVPLLALAAAV